MEVLILLLLSLLSIFIILIGHKHRRYVASARGYLPPPGPPGLPLIGNLHQLDYASPHRGLWELSKRYGPFMSLRLGSIPTLVVSSAKMAELVMKTHDLKIASRPPFVGLRKLSYNGLDIGFSPYGPYWREIKKLCVLHLFSSKRIQSFRPIRENEVAQMIHKVDNIASDHKPVNLSQTMMSFTNSVTCMVAFGKKYSCSDSTRLHKMLNQAESLFIEFYFSDYFPLIGWVDRLRGTMSKLDNVFKELDTIYDQVVHDHMDPARPKTSNSDKEVADIIDILLDLMNNRAFSFDLTLDHIKAVLMNIFIGGTDTSSAAVVWAMTALLNNPRVMNKVQGEIRGLFGDKIFITENDIERLPYFKAVVKETLRLFPPIPLLVPRETRESCNIDGYEIPPKTLVHVNAWAIARDPECWENPEEFYPERFLGSSIDFKGVDFEYTPFGAGRRMCPGMNMGVVTTELSLVNLLHSFDWEVPPGVDKEVTLGTQEKHGLVTHKKIDLCLVAKKRII